MAKALLRSLDTGALHGARVVVRADLNVPLSGSGEVSDDTRIRASLPTLELLAGAGARTILLSHLGRPGGAPDPSASLSPVAHRLGGLLEHPVSFCPDLAGDTARKAVEAMDAGEVLVLENTRFHPGETENDEELSEILASYGELYVDDAFGSAHRAHASTEGVARAMQAKGGRAVAGLLMERELRFLGDALDDPERPFVAILGGAKISGKIDVVEALLPRVDRLLVGGAMANTFFLAMGLEVGESLVESDRAEVARELLDRAGDRLVLPVDCVVADEITEAASTRVVARNAVEPRERIGDIGPETVSLFAGILEEARTVVWNGPMGVFELEPFRQGTVGVARAVAGATDAGAISVLGGGDSAAAAEAAGVTSRVSHVSTGGGASLEFLAGRELPGVAVLTDQEEEA